MEKEEKKIQIKDKIIKFLKEPILYLIIVIIFIQKIIYSYVPEVGQTGDSGGYLYDYNKGSILQGYLDQARTPVYPYFIKVVLKIGGEENLETNVVKAQKILFFISIILFYCTMKLLLKNKIVISILTLLFGILPSVVVWNTFIITESISIFEILLLTFVTIKYLNKPSKILASSMGFIVLIMILTKPAFIYLLPIYILFVILRFFFCKEERKKICFAIVSLVICGVVLIGYCMQMKKLYGNFGLTAVSYNNTVLSSIYSGAYTELENNQISSELLELTNGEITENETYNMFDEIKKNHSSEEIKEFAELSKKTDKYKMFIINRFAKIGNSNIGVSYSYGNRSEEGDVYNLNVINSLMLPITFGMVYIIILLSIIYLIWYLIKYKQINWIYAFFTSTIFANLFTLIVGAPFEEQRLFSQSICLVLLYLGAFIGNTKLDNKKNVKRKKH